MKSKFGKIEHRLLFSICVLSFLFISAFLTGCGGGGGGNDNSNTNTGNQVVITGTVSLPSGMGVAKTASRTTTPQGLYGMKEATVEIYLVDLTGAKKGNTLASAVTNGIGAYSISLPQGTEVTSTMIVSIKSGDSTIRAFALHQPADITPVSEFIVAGILSGAQPLTSYNAKSLTTITQNVVSAASQFTFANYKTISDSLTALQSYESVETTLNESISQLNAGTYSSGCANKIVEFPEECDDGNTVRGDGCSPICQVEVCGNGVKDPGEECDDGNVFNTDGCSSTCKIEVCGDSKINNNKVPGTEECDDGNVVDGDGCSSVCKFEPPACGNGFLDPLEDCDDKNIVDGDGCSSACKFEVCGDGKTNNNKVTGTEQCDDGNLINGDACSSVCKYEPAICKDGVLQHGEACEPVYPIKTSCDYGNYPCLVCGEDCRFFNAPVEYCGDGKRYYLDATHQEECDDNNNTDGDGCSKDCVIEFITATLYIKNNCDSYLITAKLDGVSVGAIAILSELKTTLALGTHSVEVTFANPPYNTVRSQTLTSTKKVNTLTFNCP